MRADKNKIPILV